MAIKKKGLIWIAITIFAIVAIIIGRSTISSHSYYTVKPGTFELTIDAKGEIQGKNALLITLPDVLKRRDLYIYQYKIKDIAQEGTSVKKGDWVATLDATEIKERLQSNKQDMEKRRAELNDAKIDSTIQLTQLREETGEFKFDLEYQKVELEQAKFESPAYQRKQQMQYNKILRQMDKKRRDYELKKLELKMRTQRIQDRFDRLAKRDSLLNLGMAATRVTVPKGGMIMYAKYWNGRKLKVGDYVSIWNPTIAVLPDMSVLVSETYIKEIDISKIAVGDSVKISIDALPEKTYKGTISKIANIGQEIPGYDTKVFRVFIDLEENDKQIKPAMTTNNNIVVEHLENVITIPRNCLYTTNGDAFVLLKKDGKIWKKRVEPGLENDEEMVINSGLEENDKILYSIPENLDELAFYGEENKNPLSSSLH